MPDDLTRRQPEDPNKININQSWEIEYWSKELRIPSKKLIELVEKVGPLVENVKAELAREKRRSQSSYFSR